MRRAALAVTAALTIGLVGCSSSTSIDPSTANRLQDAVLAVTTTAQAGDLPGALGALDSVADELDAAKVRGEIEAERYSRIRQAIDAVRTHLEAATAPPATEEPPAGDGGEAPEAPPVEESEPPADDGDNVEDVEENPAPPSTPAPPATNPPPAPSTTPRPTPTRGGGATPAPTATVAAP